MRVLIGCESSGVVRRAFRALGHDAWSCDLLPSADGSEYHLQDDVRNHLQPGRWDLGIFHPDCTYLTNSAAWAFGDGPYHMKLKPGTLVGAARREARAEALAFVALLLAAPIPRIALENPTGAISTAIRKPDQIIQPHWFGDDASKATCLWLKNLPLLVPTNCVPGRIVTMPNGRKVERWANQTDAGQNRLSPSDDRWQKRAETYAGIADAFAHQWGVQV